MTWGAETWLASNQQSHLWGMGRSSQGERAPESGYTLWVLPAWDGNTCILLEELCEVLGAELHTGGTSARILPERN